MGLPRIEQTDILPMAPAAPKPTLYPNETKEIERHGIRLTFKENLDSDRLTTYCNGDYALKFPLTITGISPKSTLVNGRVSHGAEINPTPLRWSEPGQYAYQGFDSALAYSQSIIGNVYVPALNRAFNVSPTNPLVIDEACTLVCSISHEIPGNRPSIYTAVPFTFVEDLPAPGAFRPPYASSGSKVSLYNESDIDYTMLRSISKASVNRAPATIAPRFVSYFERLWLDHVPEFVGRTWHPLANMPDYGREIAELLGQAMVILNLDYSNTEKRDLLVNVLQIAIDMNGCLEELTYNGPASNEPGGGYPMWPVGGGHGSGRAIIQMFAGFVLGATGLRDIRTLYPAETFNEFGQTYILTDSTDGDPATTPNNYNDGFGRYSASATAPPGGGTNFAEWGNQHSRPPVPSTGPVGDPSAASGMAQDDARKTEGAIFPDGTPAIPNRHLNYRTCCTANVWWGQAATALLMDEINGGKAGCDFIAKVAHDPFFMYLERYDDWVLGGANLNFSPQQWEFWSINQPLQSPSYAGLCRQFWKTHAEGASLA